MPAVNRRTGATLLEIVAVLGVLGIVGTIVGQTVTRQQRLYRATSESIDVRESVRDALSVLAEEIRSASPRDTVRLMSDSAVELFTTLGTSVACGSLNSTDVGLAPPVSSGVGLTSWQVVPDTGDLAFMYRAAGTAGDWERYRIRAVSSRSTATACPTATGLASAPGALSSSYVLTLLPSPPAVRAGAPLRFERRGRYSLYKSSGAKWYLGYRRCNAIGPSVCGAIQPISGYYKSYSSDSTKTGLLFRYYDSSNQQLSVQSDPLLLSRIQITARALSAVSVTIDGSARTAGDSGSVTAALRNFP